MREDLSPKEKDKDKCSFSWSKDNTIWLFTGAILITISAILANSVNLKGEPETLLVVWKGIAATVTGIAGAVFLIRSVVDT